jgi:hypothetical protein
LKTFNKIQNLDDDDKIKKLIPSVKNFYNKMTKKQQEKYKNELNAIELIHN